MNQINFNQTGGFPLETDTLDQMQTAYSIFHAQGNMAGNLMILSGCEQTGNTLKPGIVFIDGQTLYFAGGTIGTNVIISETTENRVFENGEDKPVLIRRSVVFGTGIISWKWADFKRIIPNNEIQNTLALLTSKVTELERKNAVFQSGGGMVLWNKPANLIPTGWKEVVDWKGRIPVGLDPNQAEYNTLGKTAGQKNIALTRANLPYVQLQYRDSYMLEAVDLGGISGVEQLGANYTGNKGIDGGRRFLHYITRQTEPLGNGVGVDVLNPYRVVLFIEYVGI